MRRSPTSIFRQLCPRFADFVEGQRLIAEALAPPSACPADTDASPNHREDTNSRKRADNVVLEIVLADDDNQHEQNKQSRQRDHKYCSAASAVFQMREETGPKGAHVFVTIPSCARPQVVEPREERWRCGRGPRTNSASD